MLNLYSSLCLMWLRTRTRFWLVWLRKVNAKWARKNWPLDSLSWGWVGKVCGFDIIVWNRWMFFVELCFVYVIIFMISCNLIAHNLQGCLIGAGAIIWLPQCQWSNPEEYRAANQYGTSVFCTDFTCKIRKYEFGLQNTEIELCQFCHLKYCCQNKAYLFWVAIQSSLVAFYALRPSNTSLITKISIFSLPHVVVTGVLANFLFL